MKDFVEIQYFVLRKLCFNQSCFWLVETIIWIRGKQFSKKEIIFCLVETVSFSQCYLTASRNHYWNKKKTVLRERERALSCLWTTYFPASRKHFFFSIFHKRILFLVDKILIPQARMKDSLKRYVSISRKSCFHRQKYLKKLVKNGFQ